MENTENECVIDGVKYVASDGHLLDMCLGCVGEINDYLCDSLPLCCGDHREDNRCVIFVKAEETKGK